MNDLTQELTSGPLAAELSPFIEAGNDGAIFEILHRKDIPTKGKLTAHDIRQYLMLNDLLLPIEASTALSCVATKRALEVFPVLDLSNPMILAKFEQVLDGLVAETLIPDFTEQHKADLLAMADVMVSRADQLGMYISIELIAQALR